MRLADLPRGENRAIINRLFNGDAPYSDQEAEENDIQVNRNDLAGPNALTQARRQWYQALLRPGNNFTVSYDSGTPWKRREWGHIVSRVSNQIQKRSRKNIEQVKATGANTLLHGIGPCVWKDRRSPLAQPLPVSSVMIPSETDIDFENTEYLAFFQEWTPSQLYKLTHGRKVDPGWNMPLVDSQWKYVREQFQKQPNATAFQYMPERIEELVKQDIGFWGSDAVPTIDVWDFYFREQEDGDGWYRRIILDWGVAESDFRGYGKTDKMPESRSKDEKGNGQFLYTSRKKRFADSLSEFFHCQFGDCSAVAPFKYHSVRSLGWMLWGVCDLETRLHCKFTESLFETLMWFFRVASNEQLTRLRKADFFNMGVIPQGIEMVKAQDRYTPDMAMVQAGFNRFRQLIGENSAAFMPDAQVGRSEKEMTATETMARVNSTNALVSGMLTLAYTYEELKDVEYLRRLCIKNSPDRLAQKFKNQCMTEGVPVEMLDVERMDVTRERALGGGNKTLEMAIVQFLQTMRKNLNPDAQRQVDHISISSATDDARLAAELAPLDDKNRISLSTHDAQLSTERLMRGLPFSERPDMVYEDYVKTWLVDLDLMIQGNNATGGMATPEQLNGYANMTTHIEKFLDHLEQNTDDKERVREYQQKLSDLKNQIKAFTQRLVQATRAKQNGAGAPGAQGPDLKAAAQARALETQAAIKARNAESSHAQRTAQKQVQFELEQQRRDRETNAEIRRENQKAAHELVRGSLPPGPFSE